MTTVYQHGETEGPAPRAAAGSIASHGIAYPAVPVLQKKSPEEDKLQMKPAAQLAKPEDEELQMKSVAQLAKPGEEELQMKPLKQLKSKAGEFPLQKKGDASAPAVNNTGMPDQLKAGIENLSGFSMDDVKVHYNSDKPMQFNALAYAQGTDIHIGPGQERHLPHEAWHVVQQKQGRVRPTLQAKGVSINDDRGLEKEADVMGGKILMSGVPLRGIAEQEGLEMKSSLPSVSRVIQQVSVNTDWGTFTDEKYEVVNDDQKKGLDIRLKFDANDKVDAENIGLTQAIRVMKEGKPYQIGETRGERARIEHRQIQAEDKEHPGMTGWAIDRAGDNPNPIYGSDNPDPTGLGVGDYDPRKNVKRNLQSTSFENQKKGFSQMGHASKGKERVPALLADTPTLGKPLPANSCQEFETTALAVNGNQEGTYYGSVSWGWKTDGAGTFEKLELTKVTDGTPSKTFLTSAKKWNDSFSKFSNPLLHFVSSGPIDGYTNIPLPIPHG